jgi:hypothetical protein
VQARWPANGLSPFPENTDMAKHTPCPHCGTNLALVGRMHRCVSHPAAPVARQAVPAVPPTQTARAAEPARLQPAGTRPAAESPRAVALLPVAEPPRPAGLPHAVRARASERTRAAAQKTTGEVLGRGGDNKNLLRRSMRKLRVDTQTERATKAGISRRTQQKQDALARKAPQLLADVKSGRKSTDAAYREMRSITSSAR